MKRIFSLRVKGAARWTMLFTGAVLVMTGAFTVFLVRSAPAPPPGTPTNLQEQLDTNADIMITWNDNSSNETGYEIWRGTTTASMSLLTTVPANTELYIDQSTTVNTLYYYKVRAYNGGGYSGYSNLTAGVALEVVQCLSPDEYE